MKGVEQVVMEVRKKRKIHEEGKKRSYIETYIPHVGIALKELLGLKKTDQDNVESMLKQLLEKQRGKMEDISAENEEYDKEFASIGKETEEGDSDE